MANQNQRQSGSPVSHTASITVPIQNLLTRRDTYRETYWESGFGENREWKEECALGGLKHGPEASTALYLCTLVFFSLF